MKYLKINDGNIFYPYHLANLKIDFPNTSFSPNTDLTEWGIHQVFEAEKPLLNNKKYSEGIPALSDGKYIQVWIELNKTAEEIQSDVNNKWDEIRYLRNQYLKDSDFTMLEDFPQRGTKLQDWKTYRQSLRNITSQLDPFNIIWPTKPV